METELVVQRQGDEIILISQKKEFTGRGGDGDNGVCSALASLAPILVLLPVTGVLQQPQAGNQR